MGRVIVIASLALLFRIPAAGQQSERITEILDNTQLILKVLASARVSGSLEYNGKCGVDIPVPDLPRVHEPQKSYANNPVNTLRSMFPVDARMMVSQKENGIIRIAEVGVQSDILDIRVSHLLFDRVSDPEQALNMVLGAPEVQSFLQTNGIGQPLNIHSGLYALPEPNKSPMPGVRSISGELNDVTLADALDYILKTFPGFWLYQNCQNPDGQRFLYFGLFPVPGKIWLW